MKIIITDTMIKAEGAPAELVTRLAMTMAKIIHDTVAPEDRIPMVKDLSQVLTIGSFLDPEHQPETGVNTSFLEALLNGIAGDDKDETETI